MSGARTGRAAAPAPNHTAAIHVLAGRLELSEGARRDVMEAIVGKRSCSDMTPAELAQVRDHFERQVARNAPAAAGRAPRHGRMSAEQFRQAKAAASPRERKVWALWHALYRAKLIRQADAAALDAWVERTVHVSALRFCTQAQLDTCIEAAKDWLKRAPQPGASAPAAPAARPRRSAP